MSEILLFHHIQGITPGVKAFAEDLRRAGHSVHAPDLFEGRTFSSIDDGMAYGRSEGFGTLAQRGLDAAAGLSNELVYAGFSFGVMPAQQLAQTRRGARGALLLESCAPVSEFGDAWPAGVPVQIHGMDDDAFFAHGGDLDAARELVASAPRAELFLYPGNRHLFSDSSLPNYDPQAAELLMQRVLQFLNELD